MDCIVYVASHSGILQVLYVITFSTVHKKIDGCVLYCVLQVVDRVLVFDRSIYFKIFTDTCVFVIICV
jgi:hypothetical protein